MSTIRAATLSNIAGTGSPVITGGELSRGRYNLNGTGTIAARDSFNIASFTDNGTGDYTSTFSTAFPNADYSVSGIGNTPGVDQAVVVSPVSSGANQAVSSSRAFFTSNNTATGAIDCSYAQMQFHGDIP